MFGTEQFFLLKKQMRIVNVGINFDDSKLYQKYLLIKETVFFSKFTVLFYKESNKKQLNIAAKLKHFFCVPLYFFLI